ncbi:hypothetical protein LTR50_001874 [Elasticomyces elasticus]|nr:hypothetical protein LTR50_001874 [Elasticomyces elasticus]
MATDIVSPPISRTSSSSSRGRSSLSLDLTDLPPLTTPSEPSNTLIITNLQDPVIFAAANLDAIRSAIDTHAPGGIHTFSPLRSFRRIIVSFHTVDAAIEIRKVLDGEAVMGERVRVYFGEPTKLQSEDQHLQAPPSAKQFFISPPPSPPHGWEMRNEGPPNREVHAEDLATALARLHARPATYEESTPPVTAMELDTSRGDSATSKKRSRSSTIVYHPEDHGLSLHLPAISVEDTTESPGDSSLMEGVERKLMHTARPPVELMEN